MAGTAITTPITTRDRQLIAQARETLEHPSLAARLSGVIGTPLEVGLKLLPRRVYVRMRGVAENAVGHAARSAVATLRRGESAPCQDGFHRAVGAFSGALGGLFGLPGLLFELPVTTTTMLRSIADIARHEGEDLGDTETRLACVQVFALGGRAESDDAAETGYYGVRIALSMSTDSALRHIAHNGLVDQGAPIMARFVMAVANRFSVPLTQKAAAQVVPCIGAVGGAAVNTVFMHHFQSMAHSHFTLRRLERKYGAEAVRSEYRRVESPVRNARSR